MMKNTQQIKLVTAIIVLLCMVTISACSGAGDSPQVTTSQIAVTDYTPSISNIRQVAGDAPQMACSNGTIYIHFPKNPGWNSLSLWQEITGSTSADYVDLARTLAYIEDGQIISVCKCLRLLGSYGDYIYYFGYNGSVLEYPLCVYNTKTKSTTEILPADAYNLGSDYDFTVDGVLRIRLKAEDKTICHISGDTVLGYFSDDMPPNTVQVGENKYELHLAENQSIYCNGNNISDRFAGGYNRSLHPAGEGVVVGNADALDGKIAYYISSEGEIVSLLPEMESDGIASTVSVYGDYVFISFIRMRYVADVLPVAYKNDTLSGTYRIDMQDLSVTKITDQHFYSMFIFDDTGIFGNNSSGMYKIDFNGNVILTIVSTGDA